MFHPRQILCPLDFSDASLRAFQISLDLAQPFGASVTLLHVVDSLGPENVSFGEAVSELQPEGHQRRLWDRIRQVQPPPGCAVPVRHLLVEGDPARDIDRVALQEHCDLIVMGTSHQRSLQDLLTRTTTERTLRQAPCPVLVVREPDSPQS
jgi:nucleotide-binding universal stress UspA family protein